MSRPYRKGLIVFGGLILIALVVAFGRSVDWSAAWLAIRRADRGVLALALTANLISLGLKAVRWWVLLAPAGVRSLSLVVRATFAGASLNNLVVAQGGEAARALMVSRTAHVPLRRVAAMLVLERALDLMSYLVLFAVATWLLPLPPMLMRWRTPASATLAIALLALLIFASRSHRTTTSPGRLATALFLSLGAWALQVVTYHLVAIAAHLAMPLAGSIAAQLAVGVSFLIRATPGNLGVFQVVYALTAHSFGIAESSAVAVALLIQMVQVLPVLFIGMLIAPSLLRSGR
ncbi:MAG: lysylphosphatidylglycerol synthase transmembrane domain-containing protein [bacterium]